MLWPEKPTVHSEKSFRAVNSVFTVANEMLWRPPRMDKEYGREDTWRTCSYCGSMHPEDLVRIMEAGARVELADMKYGWPHKLYIDDIPNPLVGVECIVGKRSYADDAGVYRTEGIPGKGPQFNRGKFYTDHVHDLGYDEEATAKLNEVLRRMGLRYERVGEGTRWFVGPPEEVEKQPDAG